MLLHSAELEGRCLINTLHKLHVQGAGNPQALCHPMWYQILWWFPEIQEVSLTWTVTFKSALASATLPRRCKDQLAGLNLIGNLLNCLRMSIMIGLFPGSFDTNGQHYHYSSLACGENCRIVQIRAIAINGFQNQLTLNNLGCGSAAFHIFLSWFFKWQHPPHFFF